MNSVSTNNEIEKITNVVEFQVFSLTLLLRGYRATLLCFVDGHLGHPNPPYQRFLELFSLTECIRYRFCIVPAVQSKIKNKL